MATHLRHASFAAEFEPAESLGRRRTPRAPVSLDARVGRGGLDRALCRVTDLSINGARLQTYSELRAGTMLWLTLSGIGQCSARVVWAHDFEAGLEFQTPLTTEEFDILTAQ
ncbi:PilZ domain-containing protein [Sphingomonas sp. DG1-23]|uniref:PilZ domain-containing protein n=1 Tax=Sphingomonas sp. DG1-23 TaxID=3068316 RepID=UPI00273CF64C|nr:PilZ domain-containing protein [Sphingomonas sp. DG1-23]MDP5278584.1 PilZ domain-containing protein [Sphingomonas sp. DG1-23]